MTSFVLAPAASTVMSFSFHPTTLRDQESRVLKKKSLTAGNITGLLCVDVKRKPEFELSIVGDESLKHNVGFFI